jgi:hypothetical protein
VPIDLSRRNLSEIHTTFYLSSISQPTASKLVWKLKFVAECTATILLIGVMDGLGGSMLPGVTWGVAGCLGGSGVALGVTDGLVGLQMALGAAADLMGSWVAMRGCRCAFGGRI